MDDPKETCFGVTRLMPSKTFQILFFVMTIYFFAKFFLLIYNGGEVVECHIAFPDYEDELTWLNYRS